MRRKKLVIAIGVIGLASLGLILWALSRPEPVQGFGTIEARNIRVGSKVGGRLTDVLVREGEGVKAGQVLVKFDDEELLAALEQARAEAEKMERGYQAEEVAEARAGAARARAELEEIRSGFRSERVRQAAAEVEQARADAENAELHYRRAARLAKEGVYSRQQRDDAEAAWKMAGARLDAAEQRYEELQRGYRPEEIAAAEARYQEAQARWLRLQRGFRKEDIAAAQARLRDAQARYRERQVKAPADAIVEVLDVRPGDLVPPNTPIAKLLEQEQLYVRIYVPETQLGHVQLGQRAEVRVDSFPDETFPGVVEQINQKAEFLPRNVQTERERVHQVFGVKIRLPDPDPQLRAGMAAEVVLLEEKN